MKFKTIVIVFNVVIVLSFLFIFFVPLALLGSEYFSLFISRNWIAGALFIVALAAVNGYFSLNWRLFGLLEREDWPALIQHLETQVYRKGRVSAKHVRLLANAYLISGGGAATRKLEEEVRRRRPVLVRKLALQFGIPYLLAADTDDAERYFAAMAADPGVPDRDWLRWNHAFCLCRRDRREEARGELTGLLERPCAPVLRLLTLYLLDTACGGEPGAHEAAGVGRDEFRSGYTAEKWKRVVEKARSNLEVVVLAKVIDDAGSWAFGAPPASGGGPALH